MMSHEKFELLKMLFTGVFVFSTIIASGLFFLRWHKQRISIKESDISSELKAAIQGEFERLRKENETVQHRLLQLENQLKGSVISSNLSEELAKQQRVSQNQ